MKKWVFQYNTPASGKVYWKEGSDDIMIVYGSCHTRIKLFIDCWMTDDRSDKWFFAPCHAKKVLIRDCK